MRANHTDILKRGEGNRGLFQVCDWERIFTPKDGF